MFQSPQSVNSSTFTQLAVGDAVRAKSGTTDPDYPELLMEGWTGVVQSILVESRTIYLVEWDDHHTAGPHTAVCRLLHWEGVDARKTPLPGYTLEKL